MFDSILVVCTGNICRSPLGERYLRNALPNKKIDSAGTGALVDHEADSAAQRIAQQNGLSLEGHKARQFTSSLARNYDLILVMEREHLDKISKIAPEARGKTMLIPDPYRKSEEAFALVFQLIENTGQRWVEKLSG